MASLGVRVVDDLGAADLAAISRRALDRRLAHDAELLVAVPRDAGVVLGAYQRPTELDPGASQVLHRGSGGAEAHVGPGTVWLQLALANTSALVPCAPARLLNRYVRPLLRGITKAGVVAYYFERDWVSAEKRPVGSLAFAHDASTGRALVEAMIAVATPFVVRNRASFMGKPPATLAELGMRASAGTLADVIVAAYEDAYGASAGPVVLEDAAREAAPLEPPWERTRDEAIGIVAAGRDRTGRLRIGGELMASRDAVARLEASLVGVEPDAHAVGPLVDASLGAEGVALFGVRALGSVRDVIVEALERPSPCA